MRKSLFVGVLGTLLLAVLLFPFLKSGAAYTPDQRNVFRVAPGVSPGGANLNFWLNITTSEAAGAAIFDRCFIEVRSTAGTLLATLATFSNQNSGTAGVYVLRGPYNLGAFAGQTVRIQFRATNDITLPTSFRVDDVTVQ
jgi:hypothetical protein